MKPLDRVLRSWRMNICIKELKKISGQLKICDIGSFDETLFEALGEKLSIGIGLDPAIKNSIYKKNYRLYSGLFPHNLPKDVGKIDVITMIAVIEHMPNELIQKIPKICAELLRSNGKIIITVPSPSVDNILKVLNRCRLIDGMKIEEHHSFNISKLVEIFTKDQLLVLEKHIKFQLGFNHLFVFIKR